MHIIEIGRIKVSAVKSTIKFVMPIFFSRVLNSLPDKIVLNKVPIAEPIIEIIKNLTAGIISYMVFCFCVISFHLVFPVYILRGVLFLCKRGVQGYPQAFL